MGWSGEGQTGWWSPWQPGVFFKPIYKAVLITLATLPWNPLQVLHIKVFSISNNPNYQWLKCRKPPSSLLGPSYGWTQRLSQSEMWSWFSGCYWRQFGSFKSTESTLWVNSYSYCDYWINQIGLKSLLWRNKRGFLLELVHYYWLWEIYHKRWTLRLYYSSICRIKCHFDLIET